MVTPTFQGEVQFRRYSDTSSQGQQIVLSLPGRDELEPFIGKEGARFMCVMVEIGPDEQPVPPQAAAEPQEERKGGPLARLAGMWANDPAFQGWVSSHYNTRVDNPEEAADIIRKACGIASRAELDHNARARTLFDQHFRIPYNRYLQGE